jgi:DNA polymerase I-like protein with 3'-5' exonuclease and polymerase domains
MFGRRYLVDPRVAYRAVNYLCQGSAADLLKKAMLKIQHMLNECQAKSALLLQIHDEVVFEVHESEDSWIPREIIKIMQDVPECRLPIKASLERADGNWEDLHKVCLRCGGSILPEEKHACPQNARWPQISGVA